MAPVADSVNEFARALASYPLLTSGAIVATLASRIEIEPFNAIARGIFLLAILHPFAAARFAARAHRLQHEHDDRLRAVGRAVMPSVRAEFLHFSSSVDFSFSWGSSWQGS